MNYAILTMDYFLDALNVTTVDKAADMTRDYLYRYREQMKRDEYTQTYSIIARMEHELKKAE